MLSFITVLTLSGTIGMAQSFRFRSNVPAVPKTGYYRVLLPPAVLGRLNANQTDIRLFDEKEQEIPYVLTQQQPSRETQFHDYELVRKVNTPTATTLVLRNPAKSPIHSLGLIIKNTNLRKKARLSGSNDARNWYGIEDDYELEPVASSASTSEAKLLDFPLSDYEYYKLEINDSLSAPLNILKVGYYSATTGAGQYSEIPGLSFSQRDSSDRNSYIHLTFPGPVRPDRLLLTIQSPDQYHRRATLAHLRIQKTKRHRSQRFFEPVQTVELDSKDSLHPILIANEPTSDLYLIIENRNNRPLTIGSLSAQQVTTYLIAELKPAVSYQLAFAAPAVGAPAYDLVYFKNKIPADLPVLTVSDPVVSPTAQAASSPVFTNPWVIWAALGGVILLLSFLSYRMVNEMKSR
ncbi:hypothetical protein GCM10027299_11910 [Larkinella ripae]